MAILKTTAGQLAINQALPEGLRDYGRKLDKESTAELLERLAKEHPDSYRDAVQKLNDLGRQVAYRSAGYGVSLSHLAPAKAAESARKEIQGKLRRLFDSDLGGDQLRKAIVDTLKPYQKKLVDDVYAESLKDANPLALQVASGSRGNPRNLNSLRGFDLLYSDPNEQDVPIPVLRSYSQGLHPAEYFASTFGARKGIIGTKMSVADAGYLGKKLNQVAHRLVVTARDRDDEDSDGDGVPDSRDETPRGLPVRTDDPDNVGALLAVETAGYPRNTPLTPRLLKHLKAKGHERLLVRSPAVGGPRAGGLFAYDAGVREFGRPPSLGSQVGMTAAQTVAEKLAQGQLGSKHAGGVAGGPKTVGGFQLIAQLAEIPKHFPGGATVSTADGRVESVRPGPTGGHLVRVGGEEHFVPHGVEVKVKPGDDVEAGDVLSAGIPNPDEVVRYKHVGEGRRYWTETFHKALRDFGIKSVSRRNVEVLSRALIDHVRLTGEHGDRLPGDLVSYQEIEHGYEPREDAADRAPWAAVGRYLEKPVLHYTVGTKVRPSVARELASWGVKNVVTHAEPPHFEPQMVRATDNLRHDPDWQVRMYGSNLSKGFLDAVHRGSTSDASGTSFVPGLAKSVGFGRSGLTKAPDRDEPQPPLPSPDVPELPKPPAVKAADGPVTPPLPAPKMPSVGVGTLGRGMQSAAGKVRPPASPMPVGGMPSLGSQTPVGYGGPDPSPLMPEHQPGQQPPLPTRGPGAQISGGLFSTPRGNLAATHTAAGALSKWLKPSQPVAHTQETLADNVSRWYGGTAGFNRTVDDAQFWQDKNRADGAASKVMPGWQAPAATAPRSVFWGQSRVPGALGRTMMRIARDDGMRDPSLGAIAIHGKPAARDATTQRVLEHELTHALTVPPSGLTETQDDAISNPADRGWAGARDMYNAYRISHAELDPRLAEIKRRYTYRFGLPVNTLEAADKAIKWWHGTGGGRPASLDYPDNHNGELDLPANWLSERYADPAVGDSVRRRMLELVSGGAVSSPVKQAAESTVNSSGQTGSVSTATPKLPAPRSPKPLSTAGGYLKDIATLTEGLTGGPRRVPNYKPELEGVTDYTKPTQPAPEYDPPQQQPVPRGGPGGVGWWATALIGEPEDRSVGQTVAHHGAWQGGTAAAGALGSAAWNALKGSPAAAAGGGGALATLAKAPKAVGHGLVASNAIDLAKMVPQIGRNYANALKGTYDEGAMLQAEDELERWKRQNPLEGTINHFTRVPTQLRNTVYSGANALSEGMDAYGKGVNSLDPKINNVNRELDTQLAGKHQRWLDHLKATGADPNAPFLDPVTNSYYTKGEYDHYQAGLRRRQGGFEQETRGMNYGDRFMHDFVTRPVAVPFFQDARVPGTNWRIPNLFGG